MKKIIAFALLASITTLAAAQTPAPATAPPAAPGADYADPAQNSYLFGLTFGSQMHGAGLTNEVDLDALQRGMKDGLQGKSPTPADQRQIQSYLRGIAAAAIARNEAAAAAFLERNGHEKGVVTTASGLQYKILATGEKKSPTIGATDKVTVDYRGKLLDGSEFDSSYSRGQPASFPVNGVIKGWQEALVMMRAGAKWQLFIPPALAYGDAPKPKIPAGSLLIFEVNVLSSEPAAGLAAPPGTPPK